MESSVVKSNVETFDLVGGGTLTVVIVEARLSGNPLQPGPVDPFCRITADFSNQIFQTHTIKSSSSPIWEESFPIYVGDLKPKFSLTVNIHDKDFTVPYLGETRIVISEHLKGDNNFNYEGWFPLFIMPPKPKSKAQSAEQPKESGKIKVGLKYLPIAENRGIIFRTEADNDYKFDKVLGQGAFGTVKLAIHKQTGAQYAAKIIDKKKMKREYKTLLKREIQVMSKLNHPNIVQLHACYDTPKQVVLIIELVTGGELFQEIISRTEPYYEKDAASIVRQLCSALEYMHAQGIAHRDLKPENLLLTGDKSNIKISDFGFSKDSNDELRTACGTALYVAPEVLTQATYSTTCDVWSIGVITYILLTAHIPFDGADEQEIFNKIQTANYSFPASLFSNVSETAKDFIRKVFVVDPRKRLNASECLKHPWLANGTTASSEALPAFRSKIAAFRESQLNLKREQPKKKTPNTSEEEDDDEEESD